jgi:uncharacterized damage-inducible protein DinB
MSTAIDLKEAILRAWQTNHRVTAFLFENLPAGLWPEQVPGAPRRSIRMIAGHVHNCRCTWFKTLAKGTELATPEQVDRHHVTPPELLHALEQSNQAITALVQASLENGGRLPAVPWLNFPPDIVHFVTYLATHEGHHRGQIVMLARQLGHRLPAAVTNGLWQWSKRARGGLDDARPSGWSAGGSRDRPGT